MGARFFSQGTWRIFQERERLLGFLKASRIQRFISFCFVRIQASPPRISLSSFSRFPAFIVPAWRRNEVEFGRFIVFEGKSCDRLHRGARRARRSGDRRAPPGWQEEIGSESRLDDTAEPARVEHGPGGVDIWPMRFPIQRLHISRPFGRQLYSIQFKSCTARSSFSVGLNPTESNLYATR